MNFRTVCRKCIYDKIMEDELDCCPVCNAKLGCAPLEKLRSASQSPFNLVLYILDTFFMLTTNSACSVQLIITASLVGLLEAYMLKGNRRCTTNV